MKLQCSVLTFGHSWKSITWTDYNEPNPNTCITRYNLILMLYRHRAKYGNRVKNWPLVRTQSQHLVGRHPLQIPDETFHAILMSPAMYITSFTGPWCGMKRPRNEDWTTVHDNYISSNVWKFTAACKWSFIIFDIPSTPAWWFGFDKSPVHCDPLTQ